MENYKLQANETVLFKGEVQLISGKRKSKVELLLTNLNFVFIEKTKKFLSTMIDVATYDVKDVKLYDEKYQIIRKKNQVDIYLLTAEKFIEFPSVKIAKEFTDTALRLVSGYSKLVRGVKKVQKSINETNEALDIDVMKIAKTTAVAVGNVAIDVAAGPGAGKKTKTIGRIAKSILRPKDKQLQLSDADSEQEQQ